MTDEKVVQLAEKHRIAGSDGALAAIREAYDVGRRDGLEEAAQWIPVGERLPEQGWVQTHEKMSSPRIFTRFFLKQSRKFVESRTIAEGGNLDCTYFVTHWRELPAPPASISSSANSVEGKKE